MLGATGSGKWKHIFSIKTGSSGAEKVVPKENQALPDLTSRRVSKVFRGAYRSDVTIISWGSEKKIKISPNGKAHGESGLNWRFLLAWSVKGDYFSLEKTMDIEDFWFKWFCHALVDGLTKANHFLPNPKKTEICRMISLFASSFSMEQVKSKNNGEKLKKKKQKAAPP